MILALEEKILALEMTYTQPDVHMEAERRRNDLMKPALEEEKKEGSLVAMKSEKNQKTA